MLKFTSLHKPLHMNTEFVYYIQETYNTAYWQSLTIHPAVSSYYFKTPANPLQKSKD
jgi:hypothetical protein